MSSTEVQTNERLPMLSSTEENANSNPTVTVTIPTEPTTATKKNADGNAAATEENNQFIQVIRPLLVELIGTTLFVLVGLSGACSGGGMIANALSFGLALMVLTASFGHISGAHFNPSVTIGVLIAGEVQAIISILYLVVQLLGGIAAGGLLRLLLPSETYHTCKGGATLLATGAASNVTGVVGTALYTADVRFWQGILIEFIATFVLVTVLIMVTIDTKSKSGLAPFVIGFTLAACILAVGPFTGGSLNPARSLGPAIFAPKWYDHHYVYWIGPLVGAIVAGLLYRAVWASNDRRMFVKRSATLAGKQ